MRKEGASRGKGKRSKKDRIGNQCAVSHDYQAVDRVPVLLKRTKPRATNFWSEEGKERETLSQKGGGGTTAGGAGHKRKDKKCSWRTTT